MKGSFTTLIEKDKTGDLFLLSLLQYKYNKKKENKNACGIIGDCGDTFRLAEASHVWARSSLDDNMDAFDSLARLDHQIFRE